MIFGYQLLFLLDFFCRLQLAEVENHRDLLKQQQSQHATKGIKDLERINRVSIE